MNLESESQVRKPEQTVLLRENQCVKQDAQETFGSVSIRNIDTVLLNVLFVFVLPGVYLSKIVQNRNIFFFISGVLSRLSVGMEQDPGDPCTLYSSSPGPPGPKPLRAQQTLL